ncbi:MAG: type I-E CRISPR-associated protein Cse2/CasB [Gammaproteobacteria bacterium]|nr:type I-E CRISPR-associated protein Cse2/CasB [Gammaproteobacteria bacterium]
MTISSNNFSTDKNSIGKVCYNWWTRLIDKNSGYMRADHAQLRRADSTSTALVVETVHILHKDLCQVGCDLRNKPDLLALIALSLAQVPESGPETVAKMMGGNPPSISGIRFNTIIRTTDPADLTPLIRRALRAIGSSVNVNQLSTDLIWWNEATRARWCFDYYGASSAIPKH